MVKKETAEQKLLKIIESQGGQEKEGAQPQDPSQAQAQPAASPQETQPAGQPHEEAQKVAAAVQGTGLPQVALPPVLTSFLGILQGKMPQGPGAIRFGLREINNIMTVIAVFVFLVLSATFIKSLSFSSKKINFDVEKKHLPAIQAMLPQAHPLQQYLDNITRRNIFQPYEKKEKEPEVAKVETKRIEELTKNFKLVGISWLDSPDSASVIIENTDNGNTYFLKQGDKINQVIVKLIYADRVVLSYQEEEIVIRL